MSKRPIKENEFYGAPGGFAGTVNYGTGYGTPTSPDVSQNPGSFADSNANKAVNQMGNTAKEAPKSGSAESDINAIYSKKDTPTPDEIVAGIKYEMGRQIKKDKHMAKETVLKNLKQNPHHYSSLQMMNIDDEHMMDNMTEHKHPNDSPAKFKVSTNKEETRKIFSELAKNNDKKYVVNSGICDVMKQMREQKQQRNSWKTGQ